MPLEHVDPDSYDALLEDKVARVTPLFSGFNPPEPTVIASQRSGFRMRAEFRVWHDGDDLNYVMFRPEEPKKPVVIAEFPIACEAIQSLMPTLLAQLRETPDLRLKLFQVEFLSTLSGETLVTLVYHRKLDEGWEAQARTLATQLDINIVGRSRKQKLVIGNDFVTEVLPINGRNFHYRQYEQSFTQPNAGVNIQMIEWACETVAAQSDDLLELYCGNGNFTLPLAGQFVRVIATELSKVATRAARHNMLANDIDNLAIVRLSAEEVSEAMAGVREFRRLRELPIPLSDYTLNTVFVDPPRAGLDEATLDMVSNFDTIMYISCNPVTLAANLEQLDTSHSVSRFALFDQFPYTEHMECGVILHRR